MRIFCVLEENMNSKEIEKYKRQLKLIESQLTNEIIQQLSEKEKKEYVQLVLKIKARIKLLEEL